MRRGRLNVFREYKSGCNTEFHRLPACRRNVVTASPRHPQATARPLHTMPSTSYPHYAWAGAPPLCPCARARRVVADHTPAPLAGGHFAVLLGTVFSLLGRGAKAYKLAYFGALVSWGIVVVRLACSAVCAPLPLTSPSFHPVVARNSTRASARRKRTARTSSAPSSTRTSSTSSSPSTGSSRSVPLAPSAGSTRADPPALPGPHLHHPDSLCDLFAFPCP